MSIHDQDRLEALRKRLYERGDSAQSQTPKAHQLTKEQPSKQIRSDWNRTPTKPTQPAPVRADVQTNKKSPAPDVQKPAAVPSVRSPKPARPQPHTHQPKPQSTPQSVVPTKPVVSAQQSAPPTPMTPARPVAMERGPQTTPVQASTKPTQSATILSDTPSTPAVDNQDGATLSAMPRRKKKTYRLKMILVGMLFFIVSVGLSSFLLWSDDGISGENITIAVTGPLTVGGGDTLPLQVGITNDNPVAINSATLIVEYPPGTQSVNEPGKALFVERLSLDTINSGETLNVPLRAVVFGEENQEKDVDVSIEYRIEGSNATFFKEADPLRFQIGSSPVGLTVDNIIKLSSGQETEVTLTVTSNSPTTLSDILVSADYPTGFDFSESTPDPKHGENTWLIEELAPESSETITISGLLVGRETDEYAINISVGVPTEDNPQELASVFVTDRVNFEIEQPFLDIDLSVAGQRAAEVAMTPSEQAVVVIEIDNTLEDTLYDTEITVELSGNALSDVDVTSQTGFYNSQTNTLSWTKNDQAALEEIIPGHKERVTFTLGPASSVGRTPQINIDVKVNSRRVSESRVAERLEGTANSVLKIISAPTLLADVGYNNSVFTDTGPIPPEAEAVTAYTLSYMIDNGSNEISGAEVSATLPPYVQWTDEVSGTGAMSYNDDARTLTWSAGTLEANQTAFVSFQLELIPSKSQINTTPTILGEQRFKGTDQFTGSVVRTTHKALTAELNRESGYDPGNGRVVE